MWQLFLDDVRSPQEEGWKIARSSGHAIRLCKLWGMPNRISFDHDLGGEDTAIKFILWMVEALIDEEIQLPSDFSYTVHSMNPVGKENIRGHMENITREFMPS
jgi:hypothetical protein